MEVYTTLLFCSSFPKREISVRDSNPHFLHQKTGIHVLCHSLAHVVGEGELISGNIGFETMVADVVGEGVGKGSEHQVVSGNDTVCLQRHELPDEGEGTFLLVGRIGTFQDFVEDDEQLLTGLQFVDD